MKINKLFDGTKYEVLSGSTDKNIVNITDDSRNISQEDLFIAVKGFETDGHKYLGSVIESGISAIVVNHIKAEQLELCKSKEITVIKVAESRSALARILVNYHDNPTSKFELIGVTGTNGKTSIVSIIKDMLKCRTEKISTIGTIGTHINGKESDIKMTTPTTPDAITINKVFDKMVEEDSRYCVMEVSSHGLWLDRVTHLDYDIGIFTNLTQDHLLYHKTMEAYFEEKRKLFLMTSKGNVINIDDPYGKRIYEEVNVLETPVLSYGLDANAEFYGKDISYYMSHTELTLVTPTFEEKVRFNIPGKIYVYNILAAVASLYGLGWSKEEILEGLKNIKPIPGRLEVVENDLGINVIVDYAHTPDAIEKIANAVSEFTKGKVVTVFGCGGDRDRTKRPIMAKCAYDNSDLIVVTSDNPRTEEPAQIINDVLEGIPKDGKVYVEENRADAIRVGLDLCKAGDSLIIAGKGHEDYQIIGTTKVHFDDKEVASELLRDYLGGVK